MTTEQITATPPQLLPLVEPALAALAAVDEDTRPTITIVLTVSCESCADLTGVRHDIDIDIHDGDMPAPARAELDNLLAASTVASVLEWSRLGVRVGYINGVLVRVEPHHVTSWASQTSHQAPLPISHPEPLPLLKDAVSLDGLKCQLCLEEVENME